jgi:hypothetical protein
MILSKSKSVLFLKKSTPLEKSGGAVYSIVLLFILYFSFSSPLGTLINPQPSTNHTLFSKITFKVTLKSGQLLPLTLIK